MFFSKPKPRKQELNPQLTKIVDLSKRKDSKFFTFRSLSSASKRSSTKTYSRRMSISLMAERDKIMEIIQNVKSNSIKQSNLKARIIKECAKQVIKENSRQNRTKLAEILSKFHPFFSKIHPTIITAIILLCRPLLYKKGEVICQNKFSQNQLFESKINKNRSKNDIGFILCGKLELANPKSFYTHYLNNDSTLFENRYINRTNKIQYEAKVQEQAIIIWLPYSSYYIIRKECFLNLDLKYMWGEFENMLKLRMVRKNLPPAEIF